MASGSGLLRRDEYFMRLALIQAQIAGVLDEVPVGAVLIKDGELWFGCNFSIHACDPTAHAEIVVLRKAAQMLHNYRLPGAELYVTVEPCVMCLGAILQARISRLVFGCFSPRDGAVVSSKASANERNNWINQLEYLGGVLFKESGLLLRTFFLKRRMDKASLPPL